MPFADHIPVLDDRRFDDLVAEARARIPRYTPEWTDLNDNEPGMALVQVFAWMTELTLYRLGRIPELNYLSFLQLLGTELRPAEPARVAVTFPVVAGGAATVLVPSRTRLSAPGDDGTDQLFETVRSLAAIEPRLDRVQAHDGTRYDDLTAENDAADAAFAPFGAAPGAGRALLFGFDSALPFPEVDLDLAVWTDAGTRAAAVTACGAGTVSRASARLAWEGWNGSDWLALDVLKDETDGLAATGHVVVRTPVEGVLVRDTIGLVGESRYWLRARVTSASYDVAPSLLAVRTNTVDAEQAETLVEEVVGGSDGSVNRVLRLADAPVIAGSLALEVDEGSGFEPWAVVDDLLASGPDDAHVALNRTTGELRFGDGVTGRIPVASPEAPNGNVVARRYRIGGGAAGNVGTGTLATVSRVEGIDEAGVTNPFPAAGGQDEETLDQAIARARLSLRSHDRAVTPGDFEQLALEAAPLARAHALSRRHPHFGDVDVPGAVTVVVVPDVDGPAPMPSGETLRAVCAHLDARRLLTTEVHVAAPTYVEAAVRAQLVAAPDADLTAISRAVDDALDTFLHPITGGDVTQALDAVRNPGAAADAPGWPFGAAVRVSDLFRLLIDTEGVERIERLAVVLGGEEQAPFADAPIPEGTLVTPGGHDVEVRYDS